MEDGVVDGGPVLSVSILVHGSSVALISSAKVALGSALPCHSIPSPCELPG